MQCARSNAASRLDPCDPTNLKKKTDIQDAEDRDTQEESCGEDTRAHAGENKSTRRRKAVVKIQEH